MKYFLKDEENINYAARIVGLKEILKVPAADRLLYTTIDGRTVIIDNTYQSGQSVVYFPSGCKICPEMLSYLSVFRDENLNADSKKTGYFEDNCRVKMIHLKGVYSEGFIIPLSDFIGFLQKAFSISEDNANENITNESFDAVEYKGKQLQICEKYVVKERQSGASLGTKRVRKDVSEQIKSDQFRFHIKVTRMGEVAWRLKPEQHINISCKYHGVSGISSNILVARKLSRWERIAEKYFKAQIVKHKYTDVCASRTVIKSVGSDSHDNKEYEGFDIWAHVHGLIKDKLWEGMTLYYEIVGYVPSGKTLQKGYDYGCEPPMTIKEGCNNYQMGLNYKVLVYRISLTSPNGKVTELPMNMIQNIVEGFEVEGLTVPQIFFDGNVTELHKTVQEWKTTDDFSWNVTEQDVYDYLAKGLPYMEQECPYCKHKVPYEGIVIRFEGRNKYDAYKLKCKKFDKKESDDQEKGETNMEDNQ